MSKKTIVALGSAAILTVAMESTVFAANSNSTASSNKNNSACNYECHGSRSVEYGCMMNENAVRAIIQRLALYYVPIQMKM